jgi:hypothetical protein
MSKSFLFFGILLCLSFHSWGQLASGWEFGAVKPGFMLNVGAGFNHQDVAVLTQLAFIDKQNLWAVGPVFSIRPFQRRSLLEEQIPEMYFQDWHALGVFIEKSFFLMRGNDFAFGLWGSVSYGYQYTKNAGYRFGDYGHWLVPAAGIRMKVKSPLHIDLGYRYDTWVPGVLPHRISLAITAF